ncbi:hypothetical protein [Streptomyces collinus]|uniref:hypothetical protein n=1 Tax=Streptomyces collinus TaxID=42684 RepID=UPI0033269CC9
MGVFARILGRTKAAREASSAGAQAGTGPGAAEAEKVELGETEAAEAVGTARATGPEGPDADAPGSAAAKPEAAGVRSAEGAEIPRQQSADEAADSEAGENART